MISTRIPSEAELIELERWFDAMMSLRLQDDELLRRDSKVGRTLEIRQRALSNLLNRQRLADQRSNVFRALLDLARTVKNPEK